MLALGVTGDVGAGKSTLTRLWGEMGASVIDADRIVRELWQRRSVVDGAVSLWGDAVADGCGKINPAAVARIAFSNKAEYRRLNGLLHPLVRIEMNRLASCLEGWVTAEIPLLFETGVPHWIDFTVYVTSGDEARARRNASRGWPAGEIERRESFLLPREEKIKRADLVIYNDGGLDALAAKAEETASLFRKLADLMQCSADFHCREEAQFHMGRLARERLGTAFFLTGGGGAGGEAIYRLTFITRGAFFNGLDLPDGGQTAVPIRRMAYGRRVEISGELKP
ncbi:MAG: dephospho-CoA kinase [Synergistaceae bacterium]|nr:dephospho-CoA kinase [Synergistaceae bacterium]